jgi:mycothiol S-conjugate amidase
MTAPTDAAGAPLRLLTVHAHPDDESSKGAPTVARYREEGILATLVCCTGGEAGDVLNPAMDTEEVRADLPGVRLRELDEAVRIIGYDRLELLGYHDSGMPDMPENARPDNFWNAPLDEAVERLVRIIRRDRPQVIVTYGDDQRNYAHPDHLKVHDITVPAFTAAGDPEQFPGAGDPWQPSKLYYTVWSRRRMLALHQAFLDHGRESPFDDEWLARIEDTHQDDRITTQIPIAGWYDVREQALRAHATQVDPQSPFWFGLPTEVVCDLHPWDDYILARSLVDTEVPESDLFAGLRAD